MSEKETIFSSSIKFNGVFPFRDFYSFCFQWLEEETGQKISEKKYKEKLSGDQKEIEIEWEGKKKITDYFRFDTNIKFEVRQLKEVEITQGKEKIKTNKGEVKIDVKGILVRDYNGKFESSAWKKFLRGIYEKWVIPSRIEQFEDKIVGDCNEFLSQAKAYLDLEGKK